MGKFYDELLASDPVLRGQDEMVQEMARNIAPIAIVDPRRGLTELLQLGMEYPERSATVAAFAVMRLALAPYPTPDGES